MSGLITLVAFLLLLGILVVVHELGHFWAARAFGIPVEEFAVGMPPRALLLAERNGVKYTLNWLPLGGYVRFPSSSSNPDSASYGVGSLRDAPVYQRIIVLAAGPLMNLLFAVILYSAITAYSGITVYQDGLMVNTVYPDTPAAQAGLQAGDIVMSVADSGPIGPDTDISTVAQRNLGQVVPMQIVRAGQSQTLQITPGPWSIDGQTSPAGFGFAYAQQSTSEPANLLTALQSGIGTTFFITGAMVDGLFTFFKSLLGLAPAMENAGLTGVVGMARGTGEIIANNGWLGYINWMAIISINLAIFNLLPIPALDGSHILFAIVERIRRRPIPAEREAMVHFIGFAFLITLMIVVTISDIQGWLSGRSVFGQ